MVERGKDVFKSVFENLSKNKTKAAISIIKSIASFVSNIIFGRSKLNSFQLARGYMPVIVGLPSAILTQDLLDIYIEINAFRSIQKAYKSRISFHVHQSMIKLGGTNYVFYKSTNKYVYLQCITANGLLRPYLRLKSTSECQLSQT